MDHLLEILENNQKELNELVKIYGPLRSHTSIAQNDSQRIPFSKRVHVNQKQEQSDKPFSRKVHVILQQSKDNRKEDVTSKCLFELGSKLQGTKSKDVLLQLNTLDVNLSLIDKSEWEGLSWALKPSMLALIQPRFLEPSCENVRLTVASCLCKIMALTAPLLPYNDDIMRRTLRVMVEALQGLDNTTFLTFYLKRKLLERMEKFRLGMLMLDLKCDDLILQMLQYFSNGITTSHPNYIKTDMKNIMSPILGGDRAICEQLRSKLLAIWRKELIASPAAYELVEGLIKQNIKLLRKKLTKEELTKICGDSKNELRRKGLCLVCKGVWALDHSCPENKEATRTAKLETSSDHGDSSIDGFAGFQERTYEGSEQSNTNGEQQHHALQRNLQDKLTGQLEKVHDERKDAIPPDDVVVESIKTMEDIHKEYGQSGIDNNPPVHPCLTTRKDGQLILTCKKVQDEYTQGESNEERIIYFEERILTTEGILQLGPFGADKDGGYHNPQVPGFRWHWDPGESIGKMIGQRIVWDPGKSIPRRIGQRIEGSI